MTAAAGLALFGLLLGKVLIAQFVLGGTSAEDILAEPDYMVQAAVYDLEMSSGFPPDVQAVYDTVPNGATFSAELWEDMAVAAEAHVASLDATGRERVAAQFAELVGGMSLTQGVMAQFSGFDLLWMFLALGTAWQMMARGDDEHAHMEPEPEPEQLETV